MQTKNQSHDLAGLVSRPPGVKLHHSTPKPRICQLYLKQGSILQELSFGYLHFNLLSFSEPGSKRMVQLVAIHKERVHSHHSVYVTYNLPGGFWSSISSIQENR